MSKKQKAVLLQLVYLLTFLISISYILLNKLDWMYLLAALIFPSILTALINPFIPVKKKKTKIVKKSITTNSKKKLSDKDLLTANIDTLSGIDFERLMYLYFKDKGFKPETTPKSGDHGVDLVITDPKDGFKIAVQCKRYKENIGNEPIIKLDGGKKFYGCHGSLCITTSNYTNKAREFAEKCKVELWNGLHVQSKLDNWRKQKLKSIS